MDIVVLDSFTADQGRDCWSALRELGAVTIYPRTAPHDVEARARSAEAVLTNKVRLDEPTIAALPLLRYVGVTATGTNVVDLEACRARGVAVSNVPEYSTSSVAQLVMAMILHFTHDVAGHAARVKAGDWARSADFSFCLRPLTELDGKVLSLLGTGAIGRRVAHMAQAFGMRVISAAVPGSASPCRAALKQALPLSDYVSLHCPLTEATQHMVNGEFLELMKPGAVLINTGRGGLVDEAALLTALESGRLGGAALDVLSEEPPRVAHPLLAAGAPWAQRLIVTPHIGWATQEARARLIESSVENLRAFLRGLSKNRVV